MLRIAIALTGAALLAACASQPLPPTAIEPEPPLPAVLLAAPLQMDSVAEAAPPPPPPEAPPSPVAPAAAAKPPQTDTGRFRISVAAVGTAEHAARWVSKVEAAGYRSEVLAVEIEGRPWQRVLLPGYASLAEARMAIPFIEQDLGVQGAWVTSRRHAPPPEGVAAAAASAEQQPAN